MVCAECRRKQFRPRKRECGIYESIKGVDACAHAKLPETAVAAALWAVPRNRDILKGDWHSSKMQAVSFRVMKRSLCTIVVCLPAFAFVVATEVAEAGPFRTFLGPYATQWRALHQSHGRRNRARPAVSRIMRLRQAMLQILRIVRLHQVRLRPLHLRIGTTSAWRRQPLPGKTERTICLMEFPFRENKAW